MSSINHQKSKHKCQTLWKVMFQLAHFTFEEQNPFSCFVLFYIGALRLYKPTDSLPALL